MFCFFFYFVFLELASFISFTQFWLLVVDVPQIAPFDFGDGPINSGDDVSVFCQVSKGDLPIGIKWSFNGKVIDSNSGVTVTRTSKRVSQLSIDAVHADHAGEYVCAAKNQAGVDRYSAVLRVNGTLYLIV